MTRPTLSLRRNEQQIGRITGQGERPEAIAARVACDLGLDNTEANALQRMTLGLWNERNAWDVASASKRRAMNRLGGGHSSTFLTKGGSRNA
jgi:hypothetical protein